LLQCSATDGAYPVTVTWDHNPSPGNLLPDSYAIYRSTTPGGGTYGYYEFQSEVKYPATSWQDFNVVPNTKYYYVIEARRYGHPAYPQYSNEDSGYFQYP